MVYVILAAVAAIPLFLAFHAVMALTEFAIHVTRLAIIAIAGFAVALPVFLALWVLDLSAWGEAVDMGIPVSGSLMAFVLVALKMRNVVPAPIGYVQRIQTDPPRTMAATLQTSNIEPYRALKPKRSWFVFVPVLLADRLASVVAYLGRTSHFADNRIERSRRAMEQFIEQQTATLDMEVATVASRVERWVHEAERMLEGHRPRDPWEIEELLCSMEGVAAQCERICSQCKRNSTSDAIAVLRHIGSN